MLQPVSVEPKALSDYVHQVGEEAIDELRRLAEPFRGARVLHVNATAFGGGVAELLYTLVPLMRNAGIEAEWRIIYGTDPFFNVTKDFHNALQGAKISITPHARQLYTEVNQLNAKAFEGQYDFVIIHDPQPAAMLAYLDRKLSRHWIWRCHIDTSHPNDEALHFLKPYLQEYESAIFTLPDYVFPAVKFPQLFFVAPAIDPLSPKNRDMTLEDAKRIIERFKIDTSRPLITQVSRFDPWKDPLGVIAAYRMVKVEIPDVQLALVGSMATDDPEGWDYYERTVRSAGQDFDIRILHNLQGVGNVEVNAFQRASDVVIQKSTREGFGLVVAEALWKGRPVVAGNVGGIPLQVIDGVTGYLVNDSLSCAQRVHHLLTDPLVRAQMGLQGLEHIRGNFLTPRLLKDYLLMFAKLDNVSAKPATAQSVASRPPNRPRRAANEG